MIDQAAESHKPVVNSGGRANAVLVSEKDWIAIRDESLPEHGDESLEKGET